MFRAIGVKIWGSFKHPAAYIYITSFDGPLLGFKKPRRRGKDEKIRQERQRWERRENIETWKKPTLGVVFFSGSFFNIKLGKLKYRPCFGPLIEVMAIYIYIQTTPFSTQYIKFLHFQIERAGINWVRRNCVNLLWGPPRFKNLLMPLFLMGCFPVDFQEVKRPLRTKSGKRPIKVGKRPIKEGKRPIKAMVLVGVSVSCLMGCFRAPPPSRKTAPLGSASLFTKLLFTIFAPLTPPPFPTSKRRDFLLIFY